MNKSNKEKLRSQILDESIFGPMVDKTFYDADLDKNGFIDKTELTILIKGIYVSLGMKPPTKEEIKNELKRLDINVDGKISKNEFRTLVKELALFGVDQM